MHFKPKRLITSFLTTWLEERARRKLRTDTELFQFLSTVRSPSTGCSYSDYWAIYSYVRRAKPATILEFGAGISTAVLAFAVKRNGVGRVISMEESEEYAAKAREIVPRELQSLIEIIHSPAIDKRFGPFVGRGYTTIPDHAYDFIFVDGPHYERNSSFDVDLLEIVSRADRPVSAIIDSRAGSCLIYNLFLKPKFRFDRLQNIGFLDKATRHDMRTYSKVIERELADHAIRRTIFL